MEFYHELGFKSKKNSWYLILVTSVGCLANISHSQFAECRFSLNLKLCASSFIENLMALRDRVKLTANELHSFGTNY